jgi:Domain of unknown function (DUF1877)
MSARGVHFAVSPAQEKLLLAAKSDRKLMGLVEEIEEAWEKPFVCETDKAWDAIHRCLTDGSLLYVSGEYPLNHCICGGRQLFRGREYTVSYVSAPQVTDVASALTKITRAWMRKRYDQLDPEEYDEVELGDEDLSRDTKLDREIPTPGLIVPVHRCAFTGRRWQLFRSDLGDSVRPDPARGGPEATAVGASVCSDRSPQGCP